MSSLIDSGADLVLSIWFILAQALNSENIFAKLQIIYMFTDAYRCLLTNRLHGKAAELCLANSGNNRVTTTRYMSTLIASTARVHSTAHIILSITWCW